MKEIHHLTVTVNQDEFDKEFPNIATPEKLEEFACKKLNWEMNQLERNIGHSSTILKFETDVSTEAIEIPNKKEQLAHLMTDPRPVETLNTCCNTKKMRYRKVCTVSVYLLFEVPNIKEDK